MKIQEREIEKALEYYSIEDLEYKNKCYKCIEDIEKTESLTNKAEEIYNILYNDEITKIDALWKIQNRSELFGENTNPFITNVLVLLGYKIHENDMNLKGYTDNEKALYKNRVRETLTNDIFIRKLDGIRISQMLWATYFIKTRLIEIGRLQYGDSKGTIHIHIPAGNKLEIEEVIDSIQKSKKEIQKYFQIENPEYECCSWLLSRKLNSMIGKNTNIAKFYNLFEVKDGEDATKDILNFVFQVEECENYSTLEESTSLQRLIKKQLLLNNKFKMGIGKLKIGDCI